MFYKPSSVLFELKMVYKKLKILRDKKKPFLLTVYCIFLRQEEYYSYIS